MRIGLFLKLSREEVSILVLASTTRRLLLLTLDHKVCLDTFSDFSDVEIESEVVEVFDCWATTVLTTIIMTEVVI